MRPVLGIKPLVVIAGGFAVSIGMFVGGLAAATVFLTAEPQLTPSPSQDVADLWTHEPRRVDVAAQDFERLPAVEHPADPPAEISATASVEAAHLASGPLVTATAVPAETPPAEDPAQLALVEQSLSAHVEWCANRYRSYRTEDNRYTHYNGRLRPCVSPYSAELAAAVETASAAPVEAASYAELVDDPQAPLLQYALEDGEAGSYAGSDHMAYCFNRYRSYRPEDNSYQPFGGGPRRQCR